MFNTSEVLNQALKRNFKNRDAFINILRELKRIEALPENKENKSKELQLKILNDLYDKLSVDKETYKSDYQKLTEIEQKLSALNQIIIVVSDSE